MTLVARLPDQVPDPSDLVLSTGFDAEQITTIDAIVAAAAFLGGLVLSRLAKRAIVRFFDRVEGVSPEAGRMVGRMVGYVIILTGLVVALEALGFSWGPLSGFLIVVLIVFALSARPLIEDLGAGLILQVRRPFRTGDVVTVGAHQGEVIEISARSLRLLNVDGRELRLPNRRALNEPIENLTSHGARMSTVVAGVDYSTDLEQAVAVALDAMRSVDEVIDDPPPEALVAELADSTIDVQCRFWHAPDILSEVRARDAVIRAVKRTFEASGIVIAFPQRVLHTPQERADPPDG